MEFMVGGSAFLPNDVDMVGGSAFLPNIVNVRQECRTS